MSGTFTYHFKSSYLIIRDNIFIDRNQSAAKQTVLPGLNTQKQRGSQSLVWSGSEMVFFPRLHAVMESETQKLSEWSAAQDWWGRAGRLEKMESQGLGYGRTWGLVMKMLSSRAGKWSWLVAFHCSHQHLFYHTLFYLCFLLQCWGRPAPWACWTGTLAPSQIPRQST